MKLSTSGDRWMSTARSNTYFDPKVSRFLDAGHRPPAFASSRTSLTPSPLVSTSVKYALDVVVALLTVTVPVGAGGMA
jgi:hypothetical protein